VETMYTTTDYQPEDFGEVAKFHIRETSRTFPKLITNGLGNFHGLFTFARCGFTPIRHWAGEAGKTVRLQAGLAGTEEKTTNNIPPRSSAITRIVVRLLPVGRSQPSRIRPNWEIWSHSKQVVQGHGCTHSGVRR